MLTLSPMRDKRSESIIKAMDNIKGLTQSYGHRMQTIVLDSEPTFISVHGKLQGVHCQYTPSGLHNKRIERATREVKEKMRAMEADLDYVLPSCLYYETMAAACDTINSLPNTMTGPTMTPYQIFTGKRPQPRTIPYGSPGIVHSPRKDSTDKAEWAIYLGHAADSPDNHRVFIPARNTIYSRRRFEQMDGYPADWNYEKRVKIIASTQVLQII